MSKKNLDWNDLKEIKCWTPLRSIGVPTSLLTEDLYTISDCKYILAVPELPDGTRNGPYATIIVWAQSDGAVLRAMEGKIEADENVSNCIPPSDILISKECNNYETLVRYLKSKGIYYPHTECDCYRIVKDQKFMFRKVSSDNHIYMFRSFLKEANETPFAIQFLLKD